MGMLKLGLIGCGQIARCNHIPEVLSLGKKARIVAMYDIKKGKAEALAKEKELSPTPVFCKSLDELLAQDIDAVMIATPNSCHYPQTLAALNAGKHVLVEKPMSTTTAEADEMIDLAEKKGLVLQVNQSFHYIPQFVMLQDLIANKNIIGKPLHARSLRCATSSPDVGWSPGATWFVQKKYNGSLVGDIAVHMADLLQWLFGPVKSVMAQNTCLKHEVIDNTTAVFRYENGATGVVELSWTFPIGANALEIYGEDGAIISGDGKFILKKNGKPDKDIPFDKAKKIKNSHGEFLAAIQSGKKTESWQIGRKAIALCCAMVESGAKNTAVTPDYRKAKKTTKGKK